MIDDTASNRENQVVAPGDPDELLLLEAAASVVAVECEDLVDAKPARA